MAVYLFTIILTFLAIILLKYHWSRRYIYAFASKLNGPTALPFLGNAALFLSKFENFHDRFMEVIDKYKHPLRIWMGPNLVVIISNLTHVEKIMHSTKILYKSELYEAMNDYTTWGLITASGPKWKEHRKIIKPMIGLKFVNMSIEKTKDHCNLLIKNMDKHVNKGYFDISNAMHSCCFDIVADIINGVNPQTQLDKNLHVLDSFIKAYEVVYHKIMKPWLRNEMIFKWSSHAPLRDVTVEGTRGWVLKAVEESKERIQNASVDNETSPIIDQLLNYIQNNPDSTLNTNEIIIDHLMTLTAASEDPGTLITSAACLCFAMYPEYQQLAAEEIYTVFGNRQITPEELPKLEYLEMCIKDVLRLFPIGPFIIRETTEDFPLDEYTIPVGCGVMIPIRTLHMDPNQWEQPDHFYPAHFLPEAVAARHPCTYLPFSMGPRNCIGRHLAMRVIKYILANILQKYEFESKGKYPDVRFTLDISVRVVGGYMVKVKRRTDAQFVNVI